MPHLLPWHNVLDQTLACEERQAVNDAEKTEHEERHQQRQREPEPEREPARQASSGSLRWLEGFTRSHSASIGRQDDALPSRVAQATDEDVPSGGSRFASRYGRKMGEGAPDGLCEAGVRR